MWCGPPASDAPFGLLIGFDLKRTERSRSRRNPPESRHIAKLRLGSQKSPFGTPRETGNWRRSSPPSPPTPLHQPAMFPHPCAHARQSSRVSYEINGNAYDKPYYLADGIYPDWATLVKTVRNPNSEKTRRFAKMQEACRKDVERGFDVLQARWAVRHPARTWSLKTMHEVMTCCVIMHNMIIENERPDGRNENQWEFQGELVAPIAGASTWADYLHMNVEVTNNTVSKQLQTDLIEHQWTMAGHEDHA
ncbi:hypothetical protein QYE76_063715 [Lolium multiflorum]|uniref:Uncharacterized protein n=1 Tax=Lolium multiflorum TaxID=4521 RepID=A0AAD8S681_LOLMU|nr:hypothetical protein QYE76_063715 [Lolium multiflorum]